MRNDCTNCSCVNRGAHETCCRGVHVARYRPLKFGAERIFPLSFIFLHKRSMSSSLFLSRLAATEDPREERRQLLLEKALEECEDDVCTTGANGMVDMDGHTDRQQLDRHGLHSSIFKWLVHRMPGQSHQKLPGIVYNEIDNQSCWALVRFLSHDILSSISI